VGKGNIDAIVVIVVVVAWAEKRSWISEGHPKDY
jgi:hypothetical protein